MRKNIGKNDRILRALVGVFFLIYAIAFHSWIALIAALFTFFESAFSWCVFYQMIGKNTCPIKREKK